MARRKAPRMKPFHEMTKQEAVERLRALYYSQPKADWDTLAVGNVILHKGNGWRITHIPPKRGFVMAANLMTGAVEKLLRSRYDTPELLVTDEATLAVLRTSHEEEIEKAVAAGLSISAWKSNTTIRTSSRRILRNGTRNAARGPATCG